MKKPDEILDLFDEEKAKKKQRVKRKQQSGGARMMGIKDRDRRKKKKKRKGGGDVNYKVKAKVTLKQSAKPAVIEQNKKKKKKVDKRKNKDKRKGRTSTVQTTTKSKSGTRVKKPNKTKKKRTGKVQQRKRVDNRKNRNRNEPRKVAKTTQQTRKPKDKNYLERKRPDYTKQQVKAVYHYQKGASPSKAIVSRKRPKNQRKRDTRPIKAVRQQLKAIREHKFVQGARYSKYKETVYQKAHKYTSMQRILQGNYKAPSVRHWMINNFMKDFKNFAVENGIEIENRVIKRWAHTIIFQKKDLKVRGKYKQIMDHFLDAYGWKTHFKGQYVDAYRFNKILSEYNIDNADILMQIKNNPDYADKWQRIKERLYIEETDDDLVLQTLIKALEENPEE